MCIIPEQSSAHWAWKCGTAVWQGTPGSGGLARVSQQQLLSPAQVNTRLLQSQSPARGPDAAKALLSSPGITSACAGNINNFPRQSYIRAPFHWGGDFCLFSGTHFLLREFCNLKKKCGRSQLVMVTLFLLPSFPHRCADLHFTCLRAKFSFENSNSHPANLICNAS